MPGAMPKTIITIGMMTELWARTIALRQTRRKAWTDKGMVEWRIASAAATNRIAASLKAAWMKYHRTRPIAT